MSEDKPLTEQEKQRLTQQKRRSEQLRANLQRRKAQVRARRNGAEDNRQEGIKAASAQIIHENDKKLEEK